MIFEKLPKNEYDLLTNILSADNPTDYLCKEFKNATPQEDKILRNILKGLIDKGFLKIMWADNIPYYVTITNVARTYEEQLFDYEQILKRKNEINISIGDNNKIKNSVIAGKVNTSNEDHKKNFYEKHPIVCSLLISLFAGFILLFSFWEQIVEFIERML